MTTAGRPTYNAKVGSQSSLSVWKTYKQSGKDQTAHTKLKYRQVGQSSQQELQNIDFKTELERKEKVVNGSQNNNKGSLEDSSTSKLKENGGQLLLMNIPHVDENVIKKYDDADAVESDFESR